MQLRHSQQVQQPQQAVNKISSICWAPNNARFAMVAADKVVQLYDEQCQKRDKFKTKPADPNAPTYAVRSMLFSPDSTRLAIAQSDNLVFVYRIGLDWSEKKVISNKFNLQTPITAIAWPSNRPNDLLVGCSDGKVRLSGTKTNKSATVYAHPEGSYVLAMASSAAGDGAVISHVDGSLFTVMLSTEDQADQAGSVRAQQIAKHSCPAYALAWGRAIVAAGNDLQIAIYNPSTGKRTDKFDFSEQLSQIRDFKVAVCNPAGDTVAIGAYDRYIIITYNSLKGKWQESGVKLVPHMTSISAMAWKPDGSKLLVASCNGGVDTYDASMRVTKYKGKYEFTYVSQSSVIVKTMADNTRTVVRSTYGYEISRMKVLQDRYMVAFTPHTLLLGDLDTCRLSEVEWQPTGQEKFIFENDQICLVYNAGELSIVQYGVNEILGVCRTEHVSQYLISCIQSEYPDKDNQGSSKNVKRIAYLVDLHTIRILDLQTDRQLATISHDNKIDWVELSPRGRCLLFRDKRQSLYLFHVVTQTKTTLLHLCSYVQWVPDSEVVVAQSRQNLYVWYSVAQPERRIVHPIKGDVETIERSDNKTEVIVEEGLAQTAYALNEALIGFASYMEDQNFDQAAQILEPLELNSETEAQWQQLASVALDNGRIDIAERCYAAVGDISKARYLKKVRKQAIISAPDSKFTPQLAQNREVQAALALLNGQWTTTEQLLLAIGKHDQLIEMYKEVHKWNDAIRVAEMVEDSEIEHLNTTHYQWLIDTQQYDAAGKVKYNKGEYMEAINLYQKAGLPARAAQVVISSNAVHDQTLIHSICGTLMKAGLYEKAGELYEHQKQYQEAKNAYIRGNHFRKVVDLARREFPAEVTNLEGQWAQWLIKCKDLDAAINHFIEAGMHIEAVETAMKGRQLAKAANIIQSLDSDQAQPYLVTLASAYRDIGKIQEAERYYIQARMPEVAVEMYCSTKNWEAAHKVARGHLTAEQTANIYKRRAKELQALNNLKDAESLLILAKDPDKAIDMYKSLGMYTDVIRLVTTFRKDQVSETHLIVARSCEEGRQWKDAERHYVAAKDFKAAVQMYRVNEKWEDALRVAKVYGNLNASKQVSYAWAASLGGEAGGEILKKLGMVEAAIEYALETGAFQNAFDFARAGAKHKIPSITLKYAMYLEDEGRFKEAQIEFIKAGKPREAIEMWVHQQDWDSAIGIAEQHDPSSVQDVLIAQATAVSQRCQFSSAETLYIKAKRPDLALAMYSQAMQWEDALRMAEDYLPHKVREVNLQIAKNLKENQDGSGVGGVVAQAKMFEKAGEYLTAIETYLSINQAQQPDQKQLKQLWLQSLSLAREHQPHKVPDVTATLSHRLAQMEEFEHAAELCLQVDDIQGAVKMLCMGGKFEEAKQLCSKSPGLLAYVQEQQGNSHKMEIQATQRAITQGGQEVLENLVQKGQWDQVHTAASAQGVATSEKYVLKHIKQCIRQQDYIQCAHVLSKYSYKPDPKNLELYSHIGKNIFGLSQNQLDKEAIASFRTFLLRLVGIVQNQQPQLDNQTISEVQQLFYSAHFVLMMDICSQQDWPEIKATLAAALLRYITIVPADMAFYYAGELYRQIRQPNMAFVYLNRYLDICEAIDEGDTNPLIENSDFAQTDIPYNIEYPSTHFVEQEDDREQIKDWVLQISMDQQVEQQLLTRSCHVCGTQIYQQCLYCYNCNTTWEQCAVSGRPILPGNKVTSKGADWVVASKNEWNTYVSAFGKCPITGTPQSTV